MGWLAVWLLVWRCWLAVWLLLMDVGIVGRCWLDVGSRVVWK